MGTKKTKIALRAAAVAIALLASALQEKEAEAKCAYQAPDGTVYVCAKGGDSCKRGNIQCPGSLVEIHPGDLLPLTH
ncbi:MAG: hypothetical protein ACSW8H_01860 [bacterium]